MVEKIEVKNIDMSIFDDLEKVMLAAYPETGCGDYWNRNSIRRLLDKFKIGQFGIFIDEEIVGCALSIIVDYNKFGDEHTYKEITGNYTFNTHTIKGDVLYGIEVFIHPDHRGLRLGRRLYDARKQLCEELNLKSIVFGGRLPNYHKYSKDISPKEYIQRVKHKEIYDPVLSFQLSNDFHVVKILKNYIPEDIESRENATLLEWDNIYYTKNNVTSTRLSSVVRLGLLQWQMRTYNNLDDMLNQISYFLDVVSTYNCDFFLLPELFNTPLMAKFGNIPESEAIRKLAGYTETIRDKLSEAALKFNVNIITGSMPYLVDNDLYNVGYLCHRNGSHEMYEKLHITPNELKYWGMKGGSKLKVFETDCAKIGVLICYDVEFPELGRLLSDEGMEILFVPFLTDTQNAYYRVKNCSQARAIENECYVAIAGSVGNLPKISNMDIQFAHSMILTPCDFAFPTNGIKGEATPNTEMVLITDVDLDSLKNMHNFGSVKNLRDRRTDLYNISFKGNKSVEVQS